MKGTRGGFRGCKKINKVNPIYVEENVIETKFDWRLRRFKAEEKERLTISEDKL